MLCGHRDTPLLGKQTVLIGEERLQKMYVTTFYKVKTIVSCSLHTSYIRSMLSISFTYPYLFQHIAGYDPI